jgi:hypothetical protein
MRDFDSNPNLKDKTELSVSQEQEYRETLETTIFSHPNHTLWEIEVNTLEVNKATYEERDIKVDLSKAMSVLTPKGKVIIKSGYAYVSALNKKNALKKYNSGNNGSKKDPNAKYLDIKLF